MTCGFGLPADNFIASHPRAMRARRSNPLFHHAGGCRLNSACTEARNGRSVSTSSSWSSVLGSVGMRS